MLPGLSGSGGTTAGAASLANATPVGAAASVLSSAAATATSSETGDVATGAKNLDGITIGGGGNSMLYGALIAGAAVLVTALFLGRG